MLLPNFCNSRCVVLWHCSYLKIWVVTGSPSRSSGHDRCVCTWTGAFGITIFLFPGCSCSWFSFLIFNDRLSKCLYCKCIFDVVKYTFACYAQKSKFYDSPGHHSWSPHKFKIWKKWSLIASMKIWEHIENTSYLAVPCKSINCISCGRMQDASVTWHMFEHVLWMIESAALPKRHHFIKLDETWSVFV
jgi:hypothetical protein